MSLYRTTSLSKCIDVEEEGNRTQKTCAGIAKLVIITLATTKRCCCLEPPGSVFVTDDEKSARDSFHPCLV